jgi:hypothetical protein
MKKYILAVGLLLLTTYSFSALSPKIYNQDGVHSNGDLFVRIVNTSPFPHICWIEDQKTKAAITFVVSEYDISEWYKVYGTYKWKCGI